MQGTSNHAKPNTKLLILFPYAYMTRPSRAVDTRNRRAEGRRPPVLWSPKVVPTGGLCPSARQEFVFTNCDDWLSGCQVNSAQVCHAPWYTWSRAENNPALSWHRTNGESESAGYNNRGPRWLVCSA